MSFKVGQKVVCIARSWYDEETGLDIEGPAFKEVVTVSRVNIEGLWLVEWPCPNDPEGYEKICFRPLDDTLAEDCEKIMQEAAEIIEEATKETKKIGA